MTKPLVILVRHGATKLNAEIAGASAERIRGWSDVPLDAKGLREGQAIADKIAAKHSPTRIVCSTLLRARQTAQLVANKTGAPLVFTEALMPWNVGDWTGQQVVTVLPEMISFAKQENQDRKPPGGESFATFRRRFLSYLLLCLRKAVARDECLVAVTHTRNTQLAKAWIAAGAGVSFDYDCDVMNDYTRQIKPGMSMIIEPSEGV